MRLDRWQLIVLAWTALTSGIVITVTVPDFPHGIPVWRSMTLDETGFWHELWYIVGTYLAGIAVIVWARNMVLLQAFLKLWMREFK